MEDLKEKADRLLAEADGVNEDQTLPPHRRVYEYNRLQLQWCNTMARADSRNAAAYIRLAQEASKRVSASLAELDKDKIDAILKAQEDFKRDGDELEALE